MYDSLISFTHSLISTDCVNFQAFKDTVKIQTPRDLKNAVSILSFPLYCRTLKQML